MLLKGISSRLSTDGSHAILLVKGADLIQSLPIVSATPAHRSFILSTWVRSYEGSARAQGIARFYSESEPPIAESRWTNCKVVTDDTGFTVHAWACGGDSKLWHVYVVPELRRIRLATRLIEYVVGPDGLKEYARPWPYGAHARVNPYLLCKKTPEGV